MGKYKSHSKEFKLKVTKEYLDGGRLVELTRKYEINKSQILHWKKQYEEFGDFPDGRGKSKIVRPKSKDTSKMTKDEYIRYLEMENDILKLIRSLNKKHLKKNS